ncbi:MAG TPA: alpha/beta hydrolase [Candidatus Paceibacterota bacterium]|nr:alpha/beta hydrolase [Candidatus Paceibacterota bacterium]
MKRVFIIHGWEGSPEANWLPWLKRELESLDFEVYVPAMPQTEHPVKKVWVEYLSNLVGTPDKNTYFVGHSIGCKAILRYLEMLPSEVKIGGALFVAGWITLTHMDDRTEKELEVIKDWINPPFRFKDIKNHLNKSIAIFSNDDPYVPLEGNMETYKDKLDSKIFIEKNAGHFTGEEDGRTEYPIILDKFLSLIS